MVIEHAALRFLIEYSVPRAKPGGPSFAADGKRVRISNGSRVEELCGQLVSKSANLIIH